MRGLWAVGLMLACLACSSEEAPPAGSSSSATGGAGGTGGDGGAGGEGGMGGDGGSFTGCHPLTNDAPEVEIMNVDQDLPAPLGSPADGGVMRSGVYHLVEMNRYTGPGGMTGATGGKWKETVEYDGPEVFVIVDQYDGQGDQKYTMTYTPDDNGAISYSALCPSALSIPYDGYTFNEPNELKLYASGPKVEWVYRMQDGAR